MPAAAFLAQTPPTAAELRAYRAETPPSIDGRLDEAVWTAAPRESRFQLRIPAGERHFPDNVFLVKISRWSGK